MNRKGTRVFQLCIMNSKRPTIPANQVPSSWRRLALATLVALVGVTGWMAWMAMSLEFNYDFEQFFPKDHPETKFYREFRDAFGSDNDFLIVGFEGKEMSRDFLAEMDAHVEALQALPHVERIQSPTRLKLPV
jgi:uncharacterized protein